MPKPKRHKPSLSDSQKEMLSGFLKDFEALWSIQEMPSGDPVVNADIREMAEFFYLQGISRGAQYIAEDMQEE